MRRRSELGLFDGRHEFAVLENGAGGVAQNAADSENDHESVIMTGSLAPLLDLRPGVAQRMPCG